MVALIFHQSNSHTLAILFFLRRLEWTPTLCSTPIREVLFITIVLITVSPMSCPTQWLSIQYLDTTTMVLTPGLWVKELTAQWVPHFMVQATHPHLPSHPWTFLCMTIDNGEQTEMLWTWTSLITRKPFINYYPDPPSLWNSICCLLWAKGHIILVCGLHYKMFLLKSHESMKIKLHFFNLFLRGKWIKGIFKIYFKLPINCIRKMETLIQKHNKTDYIWLWIRISLMDIFWLILANGWWADDKYWKHWALYKLCKVFVWKLAIFIFTSLSHDFCCTCS